MEAGGSQLMKSKGRYDVSGLVEAQSEPGSNGAVLRNKIGIVEAGQMDLAEASALAIIMEALVHRYGVHHQFKASDICDMHRAWLGDIYEWAGQYRKVNISKGGFSFAAAAQVPRLMREFEAVQLAKHTPCRSGDRGEVVKALAEVHTELVLIHPFREGNGRCARILSSLMALQADLPAPDFRAIEAERREEYFAAVQAGFDCNYLPMEKIFREIIDLSARALPHQARSRPDDGQ